MTNPEITPDCHIQVSGFTVEPPQANAVVTAVLEQVDDWIADCDGFISSNIHVSEDQQQVLNYVQWRDAAAFQGFLNHHNQPILLQAIRDAGAEDMHAQHFELVACRDGNGGNDNKGDNGSTAN
ncbi:MAG TPA: hypothetical protein DFI00_04010 [Rhodospirillaceae bacterium]|nr:hypothetical protein [Alphaproteobacteria bacterium]OUT41779.1 MAG: hypothetical protein CBB62_05555 [Micavibrio sp. TMED2]HCI46439.1 hypothetical protein [Rhodospirillaceae bacterium]MAS46637.1 hypothetical protein [Alphaproteobacteria bacterium]MAX94731.1 hypothetical protein [Alphaproteobacteria bacterium]|tara:strand:+ start:1414 stop:1785 length:372 start_codon:yes stop_codon:yes gene_type:complete